jgi:hypothetical protein
MSALPKDRVVLLRMLDETTEYLRANRLRSDLNWHLECYKLSLTPPYLDVPTPATWSAWIRDREKTLHEAWRYVNKQIEDLQRAIVQALESAKPEAPELVTLDQVAGISHVSKRTLERRKTEGKLPAPSREGGGGKPDLYDWKIMRPWLMNEEKVPIILPEHFPGIGR